MLPAIKIQTRLPQTGACRDDGGIAAGRIGACLQGEQITLLQGAQAPRRGLQVIQQ